MKLREKKPRRKHCFEATARKFGRLLVFGVELFWFVLWREKRLKSDRVIFPHMYEMEKRRAKKDKDKIKKEAFIIITFTMTSLGKAAAADE